MRTRIVMEEYYTGCQHSIPFLLNGPRQFFSVSQNTSDVVMVPCCMNSTISTPFLSQKTVASSFLADVCLSPFGVFGECVCTHFFGCSFVSLLYHSKKSMPKPFSAFCAHPWAFWEPVLRKTCDDSSA
jgi:hypothetical protein